MQHHISFCEWVSSYLFMVDLVDNSVSYPCFIVHQMLLRPYTHFFASSWFVYTFCNLLLWITLKRFYDWTLFEHALTLNLHVNVWHWLRQLAFKWQTTSTIYTVMFTRSYVTVTLVYVIRTCTVQVSLAVQCNVGLNTFNIRFAYTPTIGNYWMIHWQT